MTEIPRRPNRSHSESTGFKVFFDRSGWAKVPVRPEKEPYDQEAEEPVAYDNQAAEDLQQWWVKTVAADVAKTVPKIQEYGTRDLSAIGQFYAPLRNTQFNDRQAAVFGCLFYAVGKISRAVTALERGELPSEDTMLDLSVYSMMARSYVERGYL